jgi:hypothetical protein
VRESVRINVKSIASKSVCLISSYNGTGYKVEILRYTISLDEVDPHRIRCWGVRGLALCSKDGKSIYHLGGSHSPTVVYIFNV